MLASHIFMSPLLYNCLLLVSLVYRNVIKKTIPNYIVKLHNIFLAFQSMILMVGTVYFYKKTCEYYQIEYYNFLAVSLKDKNYENNTDFFILSYIFLLSKLYEWIDTVILIVNRKNVILLHWWHHATITVAFYTGLYTGAIFWIGFWNSLIHVIMYLYYADIKFIKPYAKYITRLQMFHLFGGVFMNYLSYLHPFTEVTFNYSIINGCICASYGLLFLRFYFNKYKSKSE